MVGWLHYLYPCARRQLKPQGMSSLFSCVEIFGAWQKPRARGFVLLGLVVDGREVTFHVPLKEDHFILKITYFLFYINLF